MFSDPSVLVSIKTAIRTELDEAEVDAKYPDSYLMSDVVPKALSDVLQRLNSDRKNKVVLRYNFTGVKDQEYYRLPANIGQITQLLVMKESDTSSDAGVVYRMPHNHRLNVSGPGYAIEGNEIRITPPPNSTVNFALEYMPSGGFLPHYSTGGVLASSLDEITLDSTPDLGVLDRREGAFNGQVVRVIPSSGPVEEGVILSHTWDGSSSWKIKLRRPLTYSVSGTVTYEIVDYPTLSLFDSVTWAAIIRIATSRRVPNSVLRTFYSSYSNAIKTEGDRVASIDVRSEGFGTDTSYSGVNGPPFNPRGM